MREDYSLVMADLFCPERQRESLTSAIFRVIAKQQRFCRSRRGLGRRSSRLSASWPESFGQEWASPTSLANLVPPDVGIGTAKFSKFHATVRAAVVTRRASTTEVPCPRLQMLVSLHFHLLRSRC